MSSKEKLHRFFPLLSHKPHPSWLIIMTELVKFLLHISSSIHWLPVMVSLKRMESSDFMSILARLNVSKDPQHTHACTSVHVGCGFYCIPYLAHILYELHNLYAYHFHLQVHVLIKQRSTVFHKAMGQTGYLCSLFSSSKHQ